MPYGNTMSNYAAGDYYRGDYYQGDPFSLKSVLGGIGKAVGGFVTGGPIGAALALLPKKPAAATTGQSLVAGPVYTPALPPPPTLQIPSSQTSIGPGGFIYQHTDYASPEKNIPMSYGPVTPTMRGMHYNKSTYETRGGGTSRWGPSGNLQIHPKGSVLVKSRRMNVGNARALKRALRRARGFERLARSVMVVHRFKKHPTRRVGRKR